MKAIQVHQFVSDFSALEGKDDILSMSTDVPKPSLKKKQVLIRVLACSISPGDVIMVHGNLIFMHESFPFIPGMDVCGVIVDANGSKKFNVGDVVVADNGMVPIGGMAEFMAVSEDEAVLKPPKLSIEECAASTSAITARNAVMDHVNVGDRVLILNGSGGVGSAAIQIAKKHAKASFVATTSSQIDFCKQLGADQVINYRLENWWEIPYDKKFDVIIDCAGGGNFYGRAEKVLKTGKQGGKFVAVTGDDTRPDCRTVWKAIKFFAAMPWRSIYTRLLKSSTLPRYILMMPYDFPQGRKQVLTWMEEGTLSIPLDNKYEFSAESVRAAFTKVASGHAHGKVVVSMPNPED